MQRSQGHVLQKYKIFQHRFNHVFSSLNHNNIFINQDRVSLLIHIYVYIIFHCEMQRSLQYCYLSCSRTLTEILPHFTPQADSLSSQLCVRLKEDVYSRVTAAAVLPKMGRGGGGGEERKGMHSWWISHFGLWPGSHLTTFKLAAACKILPHITQSSSSSLGTSCSDNINQSAASKKKKIYIEKEVWGIPLSLPQWFTLTLKPPRLLTAC